MKWVVISLLCWTTIGGLASCQVDIDEQPQILEMSIEGVPQKNITIDQDQRLITILLPPTLSSLELKPSFSFSRQAHLADPITVNLTTYCPCLYARIGGDYKMVAKLIDRVDNKRQSTHYTFVFKSVEPLRITPQKAPISYDSKGADYNIVVPVEHYYGSSYIQAIAVTKTGSLSPNWIGGGFCFEQCAGLLNQVKIPLAGYKGSIALQPGLYDLDLWLGDGTTVHATGAILVK